MTSALVTILRMRAEAFFGQGGHQLDGIDDDVLAGREFERDLSLGQQLQSQLAIFSELLVESTDRFSGNIFHDCVLSLHVNGAVIVAMIAMGMVQVPVDQVVDVVAVRHGLVTAARAVDMAGFMATALMRHAAAGVRGVDVKTMLFDYAVLLMVQVPIVKVIDMAAVLDRGVATLRSMLVRVIHVFVGRHDERSGCDEWSVHLEAYD